MDKWMVVCALLAIAVNQVPAQFAEVDFIENVQTPENRIVSGWEAYPGQLPWQVALRMVSAQGAVSSCGGSVVHHSWIITAAHCTALRLTIVVRAGVTSLSTPEYLTESSTWFNYPTYDDFNPGLVQPNDISLLKLEQRVTFSQKLKAIRVQPSAEAFANFDQRILIASGFGRTWTDGPSPEILNWVYLRGVTNPACGALFGGLITDNTMCARYYNVTSQSVCQGDSGGPLVQTEGGEPVLVGVASFVAGGEFGCHSGLPAGFCRVGPFLSWFKEVSGIDFENIDSSEEDSSEEDDTTTSPSTEAPTQPPTQAPTEPPTQAPTESPEDESTEKPGEESEEDSDSEGDSGDGEDSGCDEQCELLKKLDVKVKVHVRMRHRRRHLVRNNA